MDGVDRSGAMGSFANTQRTSPETTRIAKPLPTLPPKPAAKTEESPASGSAQEVRKRSARIILPSDARREVAKLANQPGQDLVRTASQTELSPRSRAFVVASPSDAAPKSPRSIQLGSARGGAKAQGAQPRFEPLIGKDGSVVPESPRRASDSDASASAARSPSGSSSARSSDGQIVSKAARVLGETEVPEVKQTNQTKANDALAALKNADRNKVTPEDRRNLQIARDMTFEEDVDLNPEQRKILNQWGMVDTSDRSSSPEVTLASADYVSESDSADEDPIIKKGSPDSPRTSQPSVALRLAEGFKNAVSFVGRRSPSPRPSAAAEPAGSGEKSPRVGGGGKVLPLVSGQKSPRSSPEFGGVDSSAAAAKQRVRLPASMEVTAEQSAQLKSGLTRMRNEVFKAVFTQMAPQGWDVDRLKGAVAGGPNTADYTQLASILTEEGALENLDALQQMDACLGMIAQISTGGAADTEMLGRLADNLESYNVPADGKRKFEGVMGQLEAEAFKQTLMNDATATAIEAPFRGKGEKGITQLTASWQQACAEVGVDELVSSFLSDLKADVDPQQQAAQFLTMLKDKLSGLDDSHELKNLASLMRSAADVVKDRQGAEYAGQSKIYDPAAFATVTFILRVIAPKLQEAAKQDAGTQEKIQGLSRQRDDAATKRERAKGDAGKVAIHDREYHELDKQINQLKAPFLVASNVAVKVMKIANDYSNQRLRDSDLGALGDELTRALLPPK